MLALVRFALSFLVSGVVRTQGLDSVWNRCIWEPHQVSPFDHSYSNATVVAVAVAVAVDDVVAVAVDDVVAVAVDDVVAVAVDDVIVVVFSSIFALGILVHRKSPKTFRNNLEVFWNNRKNVFFQFSGRPSKHKK